MPADRSEEHTSELQSHVNLVCRLLLEKKKYSIDLHLQGVRCIVEVFVIRFRYHDHHGQPFYLLARIGVLFLECAVLFFFFNDTATTEIYTLSLHDALPI